MAVDFTADDVLWAAVEHGWALHPHMTFVGHPIQMPCCPLSIMFHHRFRTVAYGARKLKEMGDSLGLTETERRWLVGAFDGMSITRPDVGFEEELDAFDVGHACRSEFMRLKFARRAAEPEKK